MALYLRVEVGSSVFCSSLLLCVRAVVIIRSLPCSDLRFPLATGSPSGTSQLMLMFGKFVLSLRVCLVRT